jgi:diamine N-acetyltransferase
MKDETASGWRGSPVGETELRPAVLADRRQAFTWLTASDATASMMGKPAFPDHPIPTWEEFCEDYGESFFRSEGDGRGRLFVIRADGREVGCISYAGLDGWRGVAELDAWIASADDHGRGIGSAAVRELGRMLLAVPTVTALVVRPSARNARAVAAYRKAGFVDHDAALHALPGRFVGEGLDYADALVLVLVRTPSLRSPDGS